MKILKYKAEQFNTDEANSLCEELETLLGVSLSNKDRDNPNEVHGHFCTGSEGDIEVYLYDDEDATALNELPSDIETKPGKIQRIKHPGVPHAKHNKNEAVLFQKCHDKFVTEMGCKVHEDCKDGPESKPHPHVETNRLLKKHNTTSFVEVRNKEKM